MKKEKVVWALTAVLAIIIVIGGGYLIFSNKNKTSKNNSEVKKELAEETSETAKYKIEFTATWSKENNPGNYAKNAHFSPFVAYSHNDKDEANIFIKGKRPSAGIEEMAETGKTEKLNQEIEEIIFSGLAYQKVQGEKFNSPGSTSSELEFSKNLSYLTFVSMLAPSPDWFVSQETNLFEDGKWVDNLELKLVTYDAGSDNGKTLISADSDTSPKNPVLVFPDFLQNLGKITLTRIK